MNGKEKYEPPKVKIIKINSGDVLSDSIPLPNDTIEP